MPENQAKTIFNKLKGLGYAAYGPQKIGKDILVRKLNEEREADYSGVIPKNTFKKFFFPASEELLYFKGLQPKETGTDEPKVAIWGINILDLKALGLYDLVFENDPYYQKRRESVFVVGAVSGLVGGYKDRKNFAFELKEDILEYLRFDVFFGLEQRSGRVTVWSGSLKGSKLLESAGIKDVKHIQFAGKIPKGGPDKKMLKLKKVMEKSYDSQVWDELGKICLACGKCSVACPTCFCFDFEYGFDVKKCAQSRKWGNCFYDDFTRIAGPCQFLKNSKEKIRFWYRHKFLRIPHEYGYPGCVGCGRCTKVCPVNINIEKVLMKLKSQN